MTAWLRGHGLGERALKAAGAATLAWAVGVHVPGGTAHPYFAPLAALLAVQLAVAESISGAVQRVVGIVAGVAVALAVSRLVGETAWGIGLLVLLALAVGANLRLSAQGVAQVAISAFQRTTQIGGMAADRDTIPVIIALYCKTSRHPVG